MQNSDTYARNIEDQLAQDRAELAATIEALRQRMSVHHVVDDVFGLLKSNTIPFGRMIEQTVRTHPLALAAAGAGLAWLIYGRKPASRQQTTTQGEALAGTKYEALTRWEDEGGPPMPLDDPDLLALDQTRPGSDWAAQAETLRTKAGAVLRALEEAARARMVPLTDLAQDRTAVMTELARDVRQTMRQGLEHLSESAQDQIAAAREAAYVAQLTARKAVARKIDDHPLAVAGLALALGAAVGATLPRNATEDRLLGPERDRLLDETRHLLQAERRRVIAAMDMLSGAYDLSSKNQTGPN